MLNPERTGLEADPGLSEYNARFEENKQEIARHLARLRNYAEKISQKLPKEEAEIFVSDTRLLAGEIERAINIINQRIFEKTQTVDCPLDQIEKAQNDVAQISMIAEELSNLSREQVELLQCKEGDEENYFISFKTLNARMDIRVNQKDRGKKGQARIGFAVSYKEDYLKDFEKEISPTLNLRIDVTRWGIEIDVDSQAIKEALMKEEDGRKYPDYHVKAQERFDMELFDRLSRRVFELLPEEIQKDAEEKAMREKLEQLKAKFNK